MQLHNNDCIEVMRSMPDNSVDLIATDPPYFKVKNEAWDRQWDKPTCFLNWLDGIFAEFHRILKPNGSLYVFASPQMAARVECKIAERFNVLNSITWDKPGAVHALKYGDGRFRQFVQKSERIIFAEHYGADNIAKGEAGYTAKCDELRGFLFEPLRAYLDREKERAGFTTRQVAEHYQKKTGSRTVTGMAGHWFTSVQWALPTEENYQWLRDLLNTKGGDYLKREYDYLKREYDDLKREYDDLKREYEELRRPFNVSADVPFTDVWTFPTVKPHKGKHPCAKPVELMAHIISASSKPGAVVFDPFMGGGSTGVAAQMLGRDFIGCEMNADYFEITQERLSQRDLLVA